MIIGLKRVYEAPSSSDGTRVLVDRLWPRGLTKQGAALHAWLRDLAPSNELRRWYHANPQAWNAFRRNYLKELASERASGALEELYSLARSKRNLTLLYASRNEERNNATVLKELLEGSRKPPSTVGSAATASRLRKSKRQ